MLLKSFVFFIFIFFFGLNSSAQNFYLHIKGNSTAETKAIDSLAYISIHKNVKVLNDEVFLTSEKLTKLGFIENQISENNKVTDSSYEVKISLGERIKFIHIYIGRISQLENIISLAKNDSVVLPYSETEKFLNQTLHKLEQNGFSFAKLKLINIRKKDQILFADLQFDSGKERKLNEIVVKYNGSTIFPKGHLSQINKKYRNTVFNQNVLQKIYTDFNAVGFVNQIKYPEILFTKDTTKVYVYLEKRKANAFDGFIGFANSENGNIKFNGYLDLNLQNTIGVGEQFLLNWKSDGNNQKTFNTQIEIPYLFKSPISIKAQLHIFKQDSIYQNTKTAINLGYHINNNTKLYLGYQSTESSDIQNANNQNISDYNNSFITTSLDYAVFDYNNFLFSRKTNLSLTAGIGNRKSSYSITSNNQFFINLQASHLFYLNKKNGIAINSQNYFLQSKSYLVNELLKFGGNNSIRGFAESSLQGNLASLLLLEYRYVVSPNLYLHTITDYGYYQDKTTGNKGSLTSFGFGFGVQTKNGLLNFSLANGNANGQKIKFYNTFVHICYNVKF